MATGIGLFRYLMRQESISDNRTAFQYENIKFVKRNLYILIFMKSRDIMQAKTT